MLLLEVLISISVPPLKSTPKFKPLKNSNKIEIKINIEDVKLNILYKLLKGIIFFSFFFVFP